MTYLLHKLIMALLWLRYRITVKGLEKIKSDERPILFLPNHPALIDPVIVMTRIFGRFKPRPLSDEFQIDRPIIRTIARLLRTIIIPDLATGGRKNKDRVQASLQLMVEGLQHGDNILLYPAGRLMRSPLEDVGANSAVYHLVRAVPDVRIVLLRTSGLWGSSFSRAEGSPSLTQGLFKHVLYILAGGLLFMPRRPVTVEVHESDDFPRSSAKMTMNRYLEGFYNAIPQPRLKVPYLRWNGTIKELPEPEQIHHNVDTAAVPHGIHEFVVEKICALTGEDDVHERDNLARDLAMDSLLLVEFGLFLSDEFGVPADRLDGLQTVADCILAVGGIMPDSPSLTLKPVDSSWFGEENDRDNDSKLDFPEGNTVAELFLDKAAENPDHVVVADQISGEKTYRQLITALFALLPQIKKIKGSRIGIMMPASVSAVISYLVVMFAGREPVMVNWTTGPGQVDYCLKNCGVTTVITSKTFTGRLHDQGIELESIGVHWVYLEDLAAGISLPAKALAFFKARFNWSSLRRVKISETAAILFTSGSESNPKSVPLSHENFLANGRDFSKVLSLKQSDRLLGILPVFHSLGLAGTVILPLCTGIRTVYWPNPTEGRQLARMASAYKVTTLITTPTFLQNMLNQAKEDELASLRLIFSGAEKCPKVLFDHLNRKVPGAVLCEGYGVTECSPVITVNSPELPVPGTIGRLLPSMEAVLLHPETGEEVGDNENGRLLVRGPNVFAGYLGHAPSPFIQYNDLEWYDTGDLVLREKHGLLRFAGRLKRFIKLGGEMISLPAIEEVLAKEFILDSSAEALAVAAGSGEGEIPELILLTTQEITRQEVKAAIKKAGLSPLHNIRRIKRIPEIPVLGTGKTDYRSLQRFVDEI